MILLPFYVVGRYWSSADDYFSVGCLATESLLLCPVNEELETPNFYIYDSKVLPHVCSKRDRVIYICMYLQAGRQEGNIQRKFTGQSYLDNNLTKAS